MNTKEFKKLVNSSPFKKQLVSMDITLEYPHLNFNLELKGIEAIYKFVCDQVEGWNKVEKAPPYFNASTVHFERLKNNIIELTEHFEVSSQYQFDRDWNELNNKIIENRVDYNTFVFLFKAIETDFLISVYKNDIAVFKGALDYITQSSINYSNDPSYFTGLLFAYEFKHQSESELIKRRSIENNSLEKLREEYHTKINESNERLATYFSDAEKKLTNHLAAIDKVKNDKKKNYEEWFKDILKATDDWRYTNSETFDTWFDSSKTEFDGFYIQAQESIKANEDLYREKLRLEAPAKYWKDRGTLLKKEGKNYLNWLIGISVIAAILLFTLLMLLGTDYFEAAFNDKIKGIKWSIILITIVSLLAFTIKILSKMTFSSFHLSRDAEEREQLTHFYLALKKDTTIEPEERQLILQSLFSRADTGLLKEDSSPTMPTSFIEKFAGK